MNSELQLLYENYLSKVDELVRNRKPGQGIFGMKGGPADDPCHERFAEDVGEILDRLAKSTPETQAVADALNLIYFAPKKHADLRAAYWMLLAVHGKTFGLIELLPKASAGDLLRQYCREYPRWERLPVQQQVIAKLKKQNAG